MELAAAQHERATTARTRPGVKERRRHESDRRARTARSSRSTLGPPTPRSGLEAIERAGKRHEKGCELRAAAAGCRPRSPAMTSGQRSWTETWRSRVAGPRAFSETEAYHEARVSFTGSDARCVLCQQILSEDAAARLERFQAFMKDQTSNKQPRLSGISSADAAAALASSVPTGVVTILGELQGAAPELIQDTRAWLSAASDTRRRPWVSLSRERMYTRPGFRNSLCQTTPMLRRPRPRREPRVHDEGFGRAAAAVVSSRADLEGRTALANGRNAIEAENCSSQDKTAIRQAKRATDTRLSPGRQPS